MWRVEHDREDHPLHGQPVRVVCVFWSLLEGTQCCVGAFACLRGVASLLVVTNWPLACPCHGSRYLPQVMRHNPNYARRLQTLFPLDMFGTMARFLFRPNNKLTNMVMVCTRVSSSRTRSERPSYLLGCGHRACGCVCRNGKTSSIGIPTILWLVFTCGRQGCQR